MVKLEKQTPKQQQKPQHARRSVPWWLLLVLAFGLGIWIGDQGWYRAVRQNITPLKDHIQAKVAIKALPTLRIEMAFADYNELLKQRELAQQTDVVLAEEDDFMPAMIILNGPPPIPVEMRLAEGPAGSLGPDDKWPLEIRTQDQKTLLGMHQATLQDPATNNGLHTWAGRTHLNKRGF